MAIAPPPTTQQEVFYPSEDGKPMSETDRHGDLMLYFKMALRIHYADQSDVYVSGNNFVFYQEGDPKKRVSPDCYVVFGVPKRLRDSFMSWREGERLPSVVFEFTSRKTAREDTNTKRPLYENVLRTAEYFLFDPTGEYLKPRFQGFRLMNGRYEAIPLVEGRMVSEQLGLELVQQDDVLRLFDPLRGIFLPTDLEMAQRAEAEAERAETESQRAEAEAQARAEAEAEVARLRAELAALRGEKQAGTGAADG
jgi:Uma2 family endonuclease